MGTETPEGVGECHACGRKKKLIVGAPTGERRGAKPATLCGRCWREGIAWQMHNLHRTNLLFINRGRDYVFDTTLGIAIPTVRMQVHSNYRIGYKIRPRIEVWFYGPGHQLWYGVTVSFDGRARCRRIASSKWNHKKMAEHSAHLKLPIFSTRGTGHGTKGDRSNARQAQIAAAFTL